MPGPRDLLPQPPWEGPPVPGFVSKRRLGWVNLAFLEVEEFVGSPLSEYLEDISDIASPKEQRRLKTIVAGYYLIALNRASDEVVDDTFKETSAFWDYYLKYFRGSYEKWKHLSHQDLIRELDEDNPGVKSADELMSLARVNPTRVNKVLAVDAVLHVQHETGTALTVIAGEEFSLEVVTMLERLGK